MRRITPGSVLRYRVMAYFTGVMLLCLCVAIVLQLTIRHVALRRVEMVLLEEFGSLCRVGIRGGMRAYVGA